MRKRTPAAAALVAATTLSVIPSANAHSGGTGHGSATGQNATLAVIGDVPYGADQVAKFPRWVDEINADAQVRDVVHVGDIKNGSTQCTTDYFQWVKGQLDRFGDPVYYTPGDNEWTDCHRPNNGAYNPLERLSTLRRTFFARPGVTNGTPTRVASQAWAGLPENNAFSRAGVRFATIHVVGSNNGLAPWEGLGRTRPTRAQVLEQRWRMGRSIAWVRRAFTDARRTDGRAVVLMTQADMFDPSYDVPYENNSAFRPLVAEIVRQARRFKKPVYLVNGDSHTFNVDRPVAAGSRWLSFYGLKKGANNLQRVTVDGSENNKGWLKVTVSGSDDRAPLSWQRVPYRH